MSDDLESAAWYVVRLPNGSFGLCSARTNITGWIVLGEFEFRESADALFTALLQSEDLMRSEQEAAAQRHQERVLTELRKMAGEESLAQKREP